MRPRLPVTVYYDGQCPLCLKEMGWLARHASADDLKLVNIHQLAGADPALPEPQALMAVLHARDADGHWYLGVDATLAAWQAAGKGQWLAWLRWPVIAWVARRVYAWFARHRMSISARLGPRVCDGRCQSQAHRQLERQAPGDGR